jgi:hypothetical protein
VISRLEGPFELLGALATLFDLGGSSSTLKKEYKFFGDWGFPLVAPEGGLILEEQSQSFLICL